MTKTLSEPMRKTILLKNIFIDVINVKTFLKRNMSVAFSYIYKALL